MRLAFHFRLVSLGILVTDAFARHAARKFMQFERQRQALLTSHLLITPDLPLQCVLGLHSFKVTQGKGPKAISREDSGLDPAILHVRVGTNDGEGW